MKEIRMQSKDRAVSFRLIEESGEFIVFDMSLFGPARDRTIYSGTSFEAAWKAVEAIVGVTAIPDEFKPYATLK
ncbi:hypothetical protein NST99_18090 [Paenibacillus sp. FSL L8-0470]|uniref:hypothetical protein n=1 Tax=Paenibacillus sp. FSL L8-0470 TaxID=2954688 RepID=UPI0030F648F4